MKTADPLSNYSINQRRYMEAVTEMRTVLRPKGWHELPNALNSTSFVRSATRHCISLRYEGTSKAPGIFIEISHFDVKTLRAKSQTFRGQIPDGVEFLRMKLKIKSEAHHGNTDNRVSEPQEV